MKGGTLLPAEPIRKAIQEWMDLNGVDQETLARMVGMNSRSTWRFISGETKNITWVIADHIVTKTIGPLHWHTNPDLSSVYFGANLHRLDLVDPLDNEGARAWAREQLISAYDTHRTKREAACSLGMDSSTFSRRLDMALVEEGREPVTKPTPQRGRSEGFKPKYAGGRQRYKAYLEAADA